MGQSPHGSFVETKKETLPECGSGKMSIPSPCQRHGAFAYAECTARPMNLARSWAEGGSCRASEDRWQHEEGRHLWGGKRHRGLWYARTLVLSHARPRAHSPLRIRGQNITSWLGTRTPR